MTYDDLDPLAFALRHAQAGRPVVLATVVETWGSAPRRPGHHMAIDAGGEFRGSVSGGCVEVTVIDEARRLLREGGVRNLEYGVPDEEAWAVGLACGGRIRVLLTPVGDGSGEMSPSLLASALAARQGGASLCVAFDLVGERVEDALGRDDLPEGSIDRAVSGDLPAVVEGTGGGVFLRPYSAPVRIIVIGAVHIAQPLVALARVVGFDTVVIDPREDFARPERFPGVELVSRWPAEGLRLVELDARCAVVALTHDPKLDDPALTVALESPAFYVGALGSRRTHVKRRARLAEAGVPSAALDRIHAPVGLDLGGRAPQEIAVSILAEIIAVVRGGGAARAG
jgi:xanthine dehydrogenase accessory factor